MMDEAVLQSEDDDLFSFPCLRHAGIRVPLYLAGHSTVSTRRRHVRPTGAFNDSTPMAWKNALYTTFLRC